VICLDGNGFCRVCLGAKHSLLILGNSGVTVIEIEVGVGWLSVCLMCKGAILDIRHCAEWRGGYLFLSSWWSGGFAVCSLGGTGRFLAISAFAARLDTFCQCSGTNRGACGLSC
jgi:hypothetical protein